MIQRAPWGGLALSRREPSTAVDVTLVGLPYDGAACWRKGAAEAPARLREISTTSPAISEEGFVVDPERFRVRDIGDVDPEPEAGPGDGNEERSRRQYLERVESRAREVEAAGASFLLALGGDHSVTIPLVRAFDSSGPFGLVVLDAHPDLFDLYEGSRLSHACPMRRALEGQNLDPEHLLILGTRSYNQVELDFMHEHGVRFVPAREVAHRGAESVVEDVRSRLAGVTRVYLSLDIDVADPACAPGTGAPVAGGLSARQTLDLVKGLMEELPVGGMDLVEVAPMLDPTGATVFLALQIVFETFAVLARKRL
jgi:agmatinase